MGESPEPLVTVAAIVAGAGASGAVSGLVKNFVPQIAPDIAGAIAGGALYYFGDRVHPLLKAFGVGVLAGSLKGMIEKAIPPIGGSSSSSSSSSSSPTTQTSAQQMAKAYLLTQGVIPN